eukprot:SAG31_NODE_14943_length_779_cov_1.016176_1_plen_150_part_10
MGVNPDSHDSHDSHDVSSLDQCSRQAWASSFLLTGRVPGGAGYTAKRRNDGGCLYKWGPTILVGLSTLLISANNIRQVLEDNHIWLDSNQRGFMGPGLLKSATAYQCAVAGKCCPSQDPQYGGSPFMTVYDKTCKTHTPACPHVDIPWDF